MLRVFRVVLFKAVDWCSCFTPKIQHGGDWERPRPQARKNFHNFLMTVRTLSWACDLVPEMLLILKKNIFDLIIRPEGLFMTVKKCPTFLYAVNMWLKPLSLTLSRCELGRPDVLIHLVCALLFIRGSLLEPLSRQLHFVLLLLLLLSVTVGDNRLNFTPNPYNAEILLHKKVCIFLFESIINVLFSSFRSFEYLCYGSTAIIIF